uniref:Circadian clock protein KaiC n=1 Tax=uncultured crenarchaeote TaxID=29281 RepID=H5SB96_9CREN|nr:circadian clock protein KaiC [uncultured crenarchaeote]
MVERVVTGIRGLDAMLNGGLPKGSMIAVIGPPGSGKTTLGLQYLVAATSLGKPAAIMLTFSPMTFDTIAESFGWSPAFLQKLEILYLYSTDSADAKGFRYSANIFQLTDISILLSSILENVGISDNMRLVIDSLSDIMILHRDEAALATFVRAVKSKLQQKGVTSLVMIEEGMHDAKLMSMVEFICDGTIVLKQEGDERLLKVKRMLGTSPSAGWSRFMISNGLEIISDEFFY